MRTRLGRAVLAVAALLATAGQAAPSPGGTRTAEAREAVFDAAWKAVDETFYDPGFRGVDWRAVGDRYRAQLRGVTDDEGLAKLINAMLGELKSSHLYVSRTTGGSGGVGIGARIEPVEGVDTVLELAPLSDAAAQGLRVGDRLLGGASALEGPAGSIVEAAVERCDGTVERLRIRRERWAFPLRHPGFEWSRLRVAPDKVLGYIRIDRFDDGAAELADAAMAALGKTQGIVIDVRANTGGNISALRLAAYFAERGGPTVALLARPYLERLGRPVTAADIAQAPQTTGAYTTEKVLEAVSAGGGAAVFRMEELGERRYRGPVVVLMGPVTSSAAEGFALAMQRQTKARLVGEPTAGYILSGETVEIAPGWSLTAPTAGIWTADGEDTGDRPVSPHETVVQTRADLCAGRDRAAERAVALLTGG